MRRRDGGAGRKVGAGDAAFNSGSRRPAIPGLALGRRPRTRLATSYSGGVGAPPGGTTASRQELADCDAHRVAESAARRRKENAAAGRRKARRPPSLAGDLGRSRDRADREAAHRVRRSAPAPVGALLPSFFPGSGRTKGIRRPTQTGGGALASLRHSGRAKRESPESITTGAREWNADRSTMRGSWLWIPGPALPRRPGMTARMTTPPRACFIDPWPRNQPQKSTSSASAK